MAIFRCKMCGGDLEIEEGSSVATCEYCGRQQTVPTVRDENLQGLFNRANVLRMKSEFDKAEAIYERILQNDEKEAEAYWGLILCKYGIEYVEDPQSGQRIPTCHRTSYDAITADEDYKNAIQYADSVQRGIYESEAKAIDEIQKGILSISMKEEPYDVFICYKESDDDGKRTIDSTIANDIYYQLTQEGFKVFYAAITLEDKLGQEYEPYIFSALNTAKVMISLGTKPEFFNAVWVKNEWSRYLKLMKKDRTKLLIPCYRDMDAYELPEEFAHLQAQDMSKIGFINDLIRGIRKVIGSENSKAVSAIQTHSSEHVVSVQPVVGSNIEALLARGLMALEDAEWDKADGFFEEILNQYAECAEAYLGKWLAKVRQKELSVALYAIVQKYDTKEKETIVRKLGEEEHAKIADHIKEMTEKHQLSGFFSANQIEELYKLCYEEKRYDSSLPFKQKQKEVVWQEINEEKLLVRARQYAAGKTKEVLEQIWKEVDEVLNRRIEQAAKEDEMLIQEIDQWRADRLKSVDRKVQNLYNDAVKEREEKYQNLVREMNDALQLEEESRLKIYENLSARFRGMNYYKDTKALEGRCKELYQELWDLMRKQRQKRKKRVFCVFCLLFIIGIIFLLSVTVIIPNYNYRQAVSYMDSGKYSDAGDIFKRLGSYKDSRQKYRETKFDNFKISLSEKDDGISFGVYEGEEIQWKVLDRQEDKVLLLCEDILGDQPFSSNNDCDWNTCDIRTWLNTSLWEEAFNDMEKTCVIPYSTTEITTDNIFLLNKAEVEKYFLKEERIGDFSWWLRDHSQSSRIVKAFFCVRPSGDIYEMTYDEMYGVRPAIWVSTTP